VSSQREKAERFVELHRGEPFVIPNPWDVGSALELEKLGFPALTTTSSGFAWTLGKEDGEATLDEVVEHVRALAAATTVPLAVDLENHVDGIARVADAGAVGASIEDWDGTRLYSVDEAVARLRSAADATHSLSHPFSSAARRTTSAASTTSTTRSRGCRRTRRQAPTASTRPGFAPSSRSARSATPSRSRSTSSCSAA
jgi:2-methylisocitrate lyase-like PEP mutase family enzyme